MNAFDRIQYYFENLIHMTFIGEFKVDNSLIEVNQINEKTKWLLQDSYPKYKTLFEEDDICFSLKQFIDLIVADKDIIGEYLAILNLLTKKKNEQVQHTKWKYFEINETFTYSGDQTLALKSNRPEGFLTNLIPFGDFKKDGGIYIDIFTVAQIHHKKIVGFQGLLPIVNERRNYYIKNKKESELNVFHSLLVDMKNNAPSLLNNILVHETKLSQKAKGTISYARDYINGIIDQSKSVLTLFSKYAYSDYVFEEIEIKHLEEIILKKTATFQEDVNITYSIEKKALKKSSFLIPEVFDYFLDQLIKNAIKEYKNQKTTLTKRQIKIDLTIIESQKKEILKTSILSKNTAIKSPMLLNQAGKRPVQSSTSTGLGFYFLNILLELLKASLPTKDKERYFDLYCEKDKGVYFDFYYLTA